MRRALPYFALAALAAFGGCGPCDADPPPERLLPVRLAGRTGYADPTGALVLEFAWSEARRFVDGLAVVGEGPPDARRYGVIDESGRAVVPPQYAELADYAENLARFLADTPAGPRYGYLDPAGRVAIAPRFLEAGNFSEGLAAASEGERERRGYIDSHGEFAIELARSPLASGDFHEGHAVIVYNPLDQRLIDRHGRERLAGSQRLGERFSEGMIPSYSSARERYQYLSPNSKPAFPDEFVFARPFSGGRALVKPGGSALFGYLDTKGALAIPAQFRQAGDFDQHPAPLAPVQPEGATRWGYSDAAGKLAIAARFVWAGPFQGDWAPVETAIGPNLVGRDGRLLWDPEALPPAAWEREILATLAGRPLLRLEGEGDGEAAGGRADEAAADAPATAPGASAPEAAAGPRSLSAGPLLAVAADQATALAAARLRPGAEFLLEGENRRVLLALAPGQAPPAADEFAGAGLVPDFRVSLLEDDPFVRPAATGTDSLRLAVADRAALGALLLAHRELPPLKALALYRGLPSRLVDLGQGRLRRYPLLLDAAEAGTLPAEQLAEAFGPLPFQDEAGGWRLLALSGDFASETVYTTLGALAERRRPYRRDGRWGFLDAAGRELSGPRWAWAEAYSEGLAAVSADSLRIGFIDLAGELVIPPRFRGVDAFQAGLCMAVVDSLGGYIDRAGAWAIPPRFAWSGAFAQGLAAASLDGRAVGFIDTKGEFAIAPRFQYAGEFSEGLAPVTEGGRVGYVNLQGKLVIPCRYEEGMGFAEGLAAVQREGLVAYVDAAGRERIPPRYAAGTPFAGGVALVVEGERLLVIDREGRALWRSAP